MRLPPLSALVLLLILSFSSTVFACDCLTLDAQESFKEAAVVFEGELIRSEESGFNILYTFGVSKSLKGEPRSEFTLVESHFNCSPSFFPNTIYRVYAREHEGKLSSSSCLANRVIRSKKVNSQVGYQSTFQWSRWTNKVIIAGIAGVTLLIVWVLARGLRPQTG